MTGQQSKTSLQYDINAAFRKKNGLKRDFLLVEDVLPSSAKYLSLLLINY